MCGRFTLKTLADEVIEQFQLARLADRQLALFEPRYNIAPTQDVLAVRQPEGAQRELAVMRWGLLPSWVKEPNKGPPLINARAETVAEKPSFRSALKSRRCLIIADGFYEWPRAEGGKSNRKQPHHIHRRDNKPFGFAGLWERWGAKDRSGPVIESCTIITTAAAGFMTDLHDRMPVILADGDYQTWLDPSTQDARDLQHLLQPYEPDELQADPVGSYVNKVANEGPACLERQQSLF